MQGFDLQENVMFKMSKQKTENLQSKKSLSTVGRISTAVQDKNGRMNLTIHC